MREDAKIKKSVMRNHYGPEDTEEIMKQKIEKNQQKKSELSNVLITQIEVFSKL